MNSDSLPYFLRNKKWYYPNPEVSYYGCLLTEEGKKTPK